MTLHSIVVTPHCRFATTEHNSGMKNQRGHGRIVELRVGDFNLLLDFNHVVWALFLICSINRIP